MIDLLIELPLYSALHAPGAGDVVRWAAALLSCAIGIFLLDAFSRWILHTTRRREREAAVRGLEDAIRVRRPLPSAVGAVS